MTTVDRAGSPDLAELNGVISEVEAAISHAASPKQQDAVLAFSRRTGAAPDTRLLMEDAVALLTEILQADLGGVGEIGADGRTLTLRIAAVDRSGALANPIVHQTRLDAEDSLAAFALNRARPITMANLPAAPRFTDGFLRSRGVVGALTVPLHLNARPYGVLGVYTRRERQFDDGDVSFAETIAHLLTSSIARATAEAALSEQRKVHSTVLEMVDALVLTLDDHGHVVNANRILQEITQFSPEEMRGRAFWEILAAPEESDLIQGIFRSSQNGNVPNEFEGRLLTKDGHQRKVSWSLKVLSNGQVQSVILTGTDQTEQLKTQEELEKVSSVAKRAILALQKLRDEADSADPASEPAPPPHNASASHEKNETTPAPPDAPSQPFHPLEAQTRADHRASPRRAYRYVQLVAPFNLATLPRPKDFFPVECNDISAGGLSFLLDQPPKFTNLVIALGRPPSLSHFTARVVRVAGCEQNGRTRHLVGCRFTGRVYM